MANNEDLNVGISFNADTSGLAEAAKAMQRLEKQLASAANIAAEAAESIALVNEAIGSTGRVTSKSVKDLIAVDKAVRNVGDSAKNIDFSKFAEGLDFRIITRQLNNLQKRLGKDLTPVVNANNFQQASAEIQRLNSLINDELQRGLEELNVDPSFVSNVQRLRGEFEALTEGGAGAAKGLINFESLRSESEKVIQSSEEIGQRLREIEGDARVGVEGAVDEFRQLSAQLRDNEARAKKLSQELIEVQDEFKFFAADVNRGLSGAGIDPIRFEDIFPTSEQQKLNQLKSRLDSAVRESVQQTAFRDTVRFFTGLNLQTSQLDSNVVQLSSHLPRLRYALYDVSNTAAILGGALIAASAGVVKVAADFERAFADVERTVGDGSEASVKALGEIRKELVQLSQELPVSFEDLAGIATLAGQLNVAESRIASFTSTVAQFTATTDVTLEAAATAFGRLDQLVAGVDGNFEALASSILKVGVNAVATESDIIAISSQISSVANIAGFSAAELIGFSSALASVGTRPELARGTFTRLFTEIQQAVGDGGDQLDAFARTAGQSVDEFTAAWGAGSGAEQVIAILRGLQAEGTEADRVLAQLGITSVRDVPTLLKLAQGVEDVERQLSIAKIGFIENTELTRQYGILSATLTERLVKLNNSFQSVVATLGDSVGIIGLVVDGINFLVSGFQRLIDNPIGRTVGGLSLLLTTLSGVIALVVAGFARASAAAAGMFTAFNEGRETLLAINVNVERLTAGLNNLSGSAATASQSLSQLNGNSAAAGGSTIAFASGLESADKQTRKSAGGLILLGDGLDDVGKKSKGSIASIFRLSSGFKGLGGVIGTTGKIALNFLKFNAIGLAASLAIGGIFKLVEEMGVFEDALDSADQKAKQFKDRMDAFEESFGNAEGLMNAITQDTENFRNGVEGATTNVERFSGSIDGSVSGLSEYGEVVALATGNQELLGIATDSASEAIDRQTLVIGRNTDELIRQRIAADLAARATEANLSGPRALVRTQSAVRIGRGSRGLGEQADLLFSEQARQDIGLASFFEVVQDPQFSEALRQASFDVDALFEAISRGDISGAEKQLRTFELTAEQLAEQLKAEDAEKFAEQIAFLEASFVLGTDALRETVQESDQLREALKGLAYEAIVTGEATDFTSEEMNQFRDALKSTFDEAYAQINAERALEDSIRSLGGAFVDAESSIIASGSEIQAVIDNIINSSASTDEAIEGMSGLYTALIEGGYASADQLVILRDEIVKLKQEILDAELEVLQSARREILSAESRTGSPAAVNTQAILENNRAIAEVQARRAALEKNIGAETATTARFTELLKNGMDDVRKSTRGAASSAKDLADKTEEAAEEIRTLLDYASDLEKVFSRAFDIRFGGQSALDRLSESWQSLSADILNAQESVEELLRTQQELSADRAIKEYFLSVAEAYDDQLRASKLRAEIADLDAKAAASQADLLEQGYTVDPLTGEGTVNQFALTDDSPIARRNRAALGGLVSEYQDYVKALAESGASQDELRKATERARKEFIAQATDLGYAEEDVMQYAAAFDDLTFAINNVPRNVTIEADTNPAMTALRELEAQQQRNIDKAYELNNALGSGPTTSSNSSSSSQNDGQSASTIRSLISEAEQRKQNAINGINAANAEISRLNQLIASSRNPNAIDSYTNARNTQVARRTNWVAARNNAQADIDRLKAQLWTGGFTGKGGKYEPAGIVHKGEYVVPKSMVNQSTGLPKPEFLAQMQSMIGYYVGGAVGSGGGVSFPDAMVVELSPYDRQLLENAGNVQLRLDGRVVAQAANRNNVASAQRGSN